MQYTLVWKDDFFCLNFVKCWLSFIKLLKVYLRLWKKYNICLVCKFFWSRKDLHPSWCKFLEPDPDPIRNTTRFLLEYFIFELKNCFGIERSFVHCVKRFFFTSVLGTTIKTLTSKKSIFFSSSHNCLIPNQKAIFPSKLVIFTEKVLVT